MTVPGSWCGGAHPLEHPVITVTAAIIRDCYQQSYQMQEQP
jgi:hypothetical protein